MSSRWPLVLPLVVLLATPGSAWALKPGTHRDLAEASCKRASLPDTFCRRMGKQVFETDFSEWTNLAAHAQRELGEDRCTAADAAISRVGELADVVTQKLHAGEHEAAAIALGRALHTIQDECAHHGMTNQEHAFYSLTQTCTGDAVSPDVQPAALACAARRTDEVLARVAAAASDVSWSGVADICTDFQSENNRDACANAALPSPFMACDFLAEHKEWDGEDSSWDPTRVGDELIVAFGAGLEGVRTSRAICGGDSQAIDPATPRPPVLDQGKLSCFVTSLGCLGKVDEGGTAETEPNGGCTAGGSPGFAGSAGIALLALMRRRRS